MSFLGVGYAPTPGGQEFLQAADIAVARNVARDVVLRNTVRRMRGGMSGLGAAAPYRQGTKAWWQWYATQYLPRYYSQQQVQQYVYASPYYSQFGSPFNYGYQQYQQPYQYQPYQYMYNYPQYYNQGYYDPYGQAQYTQYQGEQGAIACQSQGGYFDYVQQTCNAIGQQGQYGPGSSPPNVVGLPEYQAVQSLNAAGFSVWELNVDGQSRGVPPGYSSNRVSITVQNGVVTAAAVG